MVGTALIPQEVSLNLKKTRDVGGGETTSKTL